MLYSRSAREQGSLQAFKCELKSRALDGQTVQTVTNVVHVLIELLFLLLVYTHSS